MIKFYTDSVTSYSVMQEMQNLNLT